MSWSDPFANEVHAERQQRYLDQLRLPYVYTPQMVVDGNLHAPGKRPQRVAVNILHAREMSDGRVDVTVTRISDEEVRIQLPARDARYRGAADIMLVCFDDRHVTEVTEASLGRCSGGSAGTWTGLFDVGIGRGDRGCRPIVVAPYDRLQSVARVRMLCPCPLPSSAP